MTPDKGSLEEEIDLAGTLPQVPSVCGRKGANFLPFVSFRGLLQATPELETTRLPSPLRCRKHLLLWPRLKRSSSPATAKEKTAMPMPLKNRQPWTHYVSQPCANFPLNLADVRQLGVLHGSDRSFSANWIIGLRAQIHLLGKQPSYSGANNN